MGVFQHKWKRLLRREVGLFPFKMPTQMMCLLVTMVLAQPSETKTVVSIPFPSISHTKYHTNVARVMSQRDHQVWVSIPTHILEKDYLDTSGFNIIPYDTTPEFEDTLNTLLKRAAFEGQSDMLHEISWICKDICDTMLRNESFISTIGQINPDLIVIDNTIGFLVMAVLPYRLNIPFAFLGTFYDPHVMGIPFSLAEITMDYLPYSNKMTFFQRIQNTLLYMILSINNPFMPRDAVSTYAPEMKYLPLGDLVCKAEIFLVERDYILHYPKPTLPNVKLIGGTASGPAKPLPPEFQSFMDSAKDGVVIVSFGSYMLGVPKHISDKILQVLLQLPMKSVFRSNLTSPDPKKIMMSSWIPQKDLLSHPHTKVFVSHCGKNGLYEALYHAVPIVATPLFTDQPYNAERARDRGFAEILDINTCTAEQMRSTILTVAKEPKYKEAVLKLSCLFKELYGVPMETAAFWLEHVMEYGGDYMRSAGQQMPWYQFVLLDVFLFIVCVLVLSVGLLYVCIRAVYKCFCHRKL